MADISDDAPLRLKDAVSIAFPMGGMTVWFASRTRERPAKTGVDRWEAFRHPARDP